MFIDSDIIFDDHHISFLMESDEPILAGIYCKKSKGIEPCINTLPGMPAETPCGGYVEIARAGTGFLRIHRSVLEKMKGPKDATDLQNFLNDYAAYYVNHGNDEWDFFSVGVRNREYLSEDWFFCDRARGQFRKQARACGFDIVDIELDLDFHVMLDTRIQVRHEGSAIFPLDEVIEKVNAAGGAAPVEQVNTSDNYTNAADYDLRDLDDDLALLDERRRRILVARFFEGKTLKEASEELGISGPRVRQLEQSALAKIRRRHQQDDLALNRMVTSSN